MLPDERGAAGAVAGWLEESRAADLREATDADFETLQGAREQDAANQKEFSQKETRRGADLKKHRGILWELENERAGGSRDWKKNHNSRSFAKRRGPLKGPATTEAAERSRQHRATAKTLKRHVGVAAKFGSFLYCPPKSEAVARLLAKASKRKSARRAPEVTVRGHWLARTRRGWEKVERLRPASTWRR